MAQWPSRYIIAITSDARSSLEKRLRCLSANQSVMPFPLTVLLDPPAPLGSCCPPRSPSSRSCAIPPCPWGCDVSSSTRLFSWHVLSPHRHSEHPASWTLTCNMTNRKERCLLPACHCRERGFCFCLFGFFFN